MSYNMFNINLNACILRLIFRSKYRKLRLGSAIKKEKVEKSLLALPGFPTPTWGSNNYVWLAFVRHHVCTMQETFQITRGFLLDFESPKLHSTFFSKKTNKTSNCFQCIKLTLSLYIQYEYQCPGLTKTALAIAFEWHFRQIKFVDYNAISFALC